jgi:hypothetical protein
MAYDPYALGSGLPLADTEAVVTAMEFRFDTEYAADACVAAITFQPDEGEEQEQLYSCGKGWEPIDRGAATAHTSGRDLNFNKQSNYGRFLAAAYECEGFLDEVREEGILPTQVEMFVGKRFHLGTVEYSTRNPSKKDSEETVKTAIVPVAYLGVEEEEAPAKPAAKKTVAKKAAAPAKGPSAIEKKQIALIEQLEEEDADMVAALRELAGESEDHESFMEAAMDIDGVADSDLAQQVAMSSKAGSIWAQAQG